MTQTQRANRERKLPPQAIKMVSWGAVEILSDSRGWENALYSEVHHNPDDPDSSAASRSDSRSDQKLNTLKTRVVPAILNSVWRD